MFKKINSMQPIPKFYGVVFHEISKSQVVLALIPFNLLFSFFVKSYLVLKKGFGNIGFENGFNEGHQEGYKEGFHDAYKRDYKQPRYKV